MHIIKYNNRHHYTNYNSLISTRFYLISRGLFKSLMTWTYSLASPSPGIDAYYKFLHYCKSYFDFACKRSDSKGNVLFPLRIPLGSLPNLKRSSMSTFTSYTSPFTMINNDTNGSHISSPKWDTWWDFPISSILMLCGSCSTCHLYWFLDHKYCQSLAILHFFVVLTLYGS